MKKITIVSIASIIFLLFSSLVAYLLRYVEIDKPLFFLLLGVIPLVISIFIAFIVKKNLIGNIVCSLISGIGLGFFIRGWYVFRNFDNPYWLMCLVSLACVIYLWIFYFISRISLFKKYFKVYFVIFLILSLIGYVLLVAFTKTTYVSTFGFYMIVEIAFIFAMCKRTESLEELIRNITLSTYSIIAVALLILIMVLAEDGIDIDGSFDISGVELLEGLEDSIDFPSTNTKKKR